MATMGAVLAPQSAAAQQREDERVAVAIGELRQTIDRGLQVSPELARIREQQRIFLRANQKFPDYIEIGIGIWESVYDWHIRHHIPVTVTRTTDGRYAMTVALTLLVLRPEQTESYISFGYDAR